MEIPPEVFGFADDTDMANDSTVHEMIFSSDRLRGLVDAVEIAINSCKDVTTLRRFAPAVNPVNWVYELQIFLESALNTAKRS